MFTGIDSIPLQMSFHHHAVNETGILTCFHTKDSRTTMHLP